MLPACQYSLVVPRVPMTLIMELPNCFFFQVSNSPKRGCVLKCHSSPRIRHLPCRNAAFLIFLLRDLVLIVKQNCTFYLFQVDIYVGRLMPITIVRKLRNSEVGNDIYTLVHPIIITAYKYSNYSAAECEYTQSTFGRDLEN